MIVTPGSSSTMSSTSSSSSTSSTEDFWHRFPGGPQPKPTFMALLKKKMRSLAGKQELKPRVPVIQPRASRDMFDEALKEFDLKLGRSMLREDFQYLQEYALNFDTLRKTNHRAFEAESVYDSAVYDDVFSEYSGPLQEFYADLDIGDYSDVQDDLDQSQYSDVQADLNQSEYSDVCMSSTRDLADYSDVYSEYSRISDEEVGDLPPPLPRRMSDSRPPARPPVPSTRSLRL